MEEQTNYSIDNVIGLSGMAAGFFGMIKGDIIDDTSLFLTGTATYLLSFSYYCFAKSKFNRIKKKLN